MEIQQIADGRGTVLALAGRLDAQTAKQAEADLLTAYTGDKRVVVADFSKVDFISSAGIRCLLIVVQKFRSSGGDVLISGLSPDVKQVFDICDLTRYFKVFSTTDEALAASQAK